METILRAVSEEGRQMALNILIPRVLGDPNTTRQIKRWVKDVFKLDEETAVIVTELRCSEPGCPPLETVIAIMGPGDKRFQHKLHKAIGEVTAEDLLHLRDGGQQKCG
jgi:hypothetical protein